MFENSKMLYSTKVALFLTLGSVACAYATVIPGSTAAKPSFLHYMGLDTAKNATQLTGAINGVYLAGALVGSSLSSLPSDILGRKRSAILSSLLAVLGGALQAGSVNISMFIAARFVTGIGIGALFAIIPLFQSEIAPPHTRGLLVGFHGVGTSLGTILPNWIGFGFYFVKDGNGGASWRIPLALQCAFTIALAIGVLFVPESPRWLINKKRENEALRSLQQLHRSKDDPDHTFAHQEYLQIKSQHDEDEAVGLVSWKEMILVPSHRRRALVAIFVMIGSQMTATLLVSVYNPILYGSLGYGTVMQLVFTGIWSNFTLIGNAICAATIDRMGRVRALKIGWCGCLIAIIGVLVSLAQFEKTGARAAAISAIAFLYLHIIIYATFVDATTYIYTSEIFPNNARGKGMAISVGAYFAILVVQLDSAPTAFVAITWRVLLIYTCGLAACTPFLWVFCPETKGKSLEEIGVIFGDRHVRVALQDSDEQLELMEETVHVHDKRAAGEEAGARHVDVVEY